MTKSIDFITKSFQATLGSDERTVEGYASTFGNIDRQNEVVMKGAFNRTLKSGRKIAFLAHHDQSRPIGVIKHMEETDQGLFFKGYLSDTRDGNDIRTAMIDGAIDSFSIGAGITKKSIGEVNGRKVTQLHELNLFEVSAVAIPANELAVVTKIKSLWENDPNHANGKFDLFIERLKAEVLGETVTDEQFEATEKADDVIAEAVEELGANPDAEAIKAVNELAIQLKLFELQRALRR